MQQALYNSIISNSVTVQASPAPKTGLTGNASTSRAAGLLRWAARKWDLVGVVALMGSSAAYGVFALAHVGL